MKSTPAAILTSNHRCRCWRVVRTDGTMYGFTNHDRDLVIDAETYQAASGLIGTAARQTADAAEDSQDIFGFFASAAVTEADLAAGKWSGARVWSFDVAWDNLAAGKHKLDAGVIGEVKRSRSGFTATVENTQGLLQQTVGSRYDKYCPHTLGDAACGIELAPATRADSEALVVGDVRVLAAYDGRRYVCTTAGTTAASVPAYNTTLGATTTDGTAVLTCYDAYTKQGAVTGVTSRQVFADTARTEVDNDLAFGWINWLTGANAGLTRPVKSNTASGGQVTLVYLMPFDIQVGDTYTIVRGCNKLAKRDGDTWGNPYTGDCRAKFNLENGGNVARFGGFPELAGNDHVLAGPA